MADEEEEAEENAEAAEEEAGGDAADEGGGGEGEDGEGGDDDDEEGGGGFDIKKIVIFVVAPLLLLGGGGAGLYFTGMLDGLLGKAEPEMVEMLDEYGEPVLDDHGEPVMVPKKEGEHGEEGDEHAEDDHGDGKDGKDKDGKGAGNFVEIPTIIVNLNSEDGTPRYLRLTVQLEAKKSGDVAKLEAVIPKVVDQFQTYLRELRVRDLRGSAGIYRLQMELLWRVNQAAAPVKVKDVLFQEILIQ